MGASAFDDNSCYNPDFFNRFKDLSMSHALTKSELIDHIAAECGSLNSKEAEVAVNTVLQTIVQALAEGRRVEIRGFGSFSLNKRAARMGRNPRTGASVAVEEKYVPKFKAGADLRAAVDESRHS